MGTKNNIPRVALAAVPILVILTLLMGVRDARAQATNNTLNAATLAYLTTGGPYGWTDLTAVAGNIDLTVTDAAGGDFATTETIELSLPSSNYEWVLSECVVSETSVAITGVALTTPDDQTLRCTITGGPSIAAETIVFQCACCASCVYSCC